MHYERLHSFMDILLNKLNNVLKSYIVLIMMLQHQVLQGDFMANLCISEVALEANSVAELNHHVDT